jgi:two-component system, chemotaxis family, sensor kinase CheA
MFHDEELIEEFTVESRAHLASLESLLLEIEGAGDNFDIELVNTVFRAVHSVKGAAGFLGFTAINALAHSLENVLNLVRNRELRPTPEIVNLLLNASDQLRDLVENVKESNQRDVGAWVEELDAISKEAPSPDSTSPVLEPPRIPAEHGVAKSASNSDEKADASSAPMRSKPADTSIRVHVSVLDQLMNLAGELVLSRNQLLSAVAANEREGLEAIAGRVDLVTSELQETIMQTRMQPIGVVFGRFPRVVRDLSRKLGKQCNLLIEGDDVEVDKTIVEALGDPLTHLVRNSIDHGIETPERREQNGKNSEGQVRLRAFHQAGKVCIRIEDDGGGIDPSRLKTKAVEKGIIDADQAFSMSDSEALRLIFAPGFSTASQITDVSGRGVGMDVVRTNIEQLGGTVDVESVLGSGTAIHITLPLTLAIVPSMIIACSGERYAVPQANIVELVRVTPSDRELRIGSVHGAEVLRLRGTLLPLIRLRNALGFEPSSKSNLRQGHSNILIIETGPLRYAIEVDAIHDNEEIVVKPLGKHIRDLGYVAGATILGDGYVALILDLVGLALHCNLRAVDMHEQANGSESMVNEEVHRMLFFKNHPMEPFAVPMAMVARIERIRREEVKVIGDQYILVYRGQSLPVLRVEQHLRAMPPCAAGEFEYVIVFRVQDREVGLIAPVIGDIRDIHMRIDSTTLREPGVLGSLVVEGETTRVLDLVELVRIKHPDWGSNHQVSKTKSRDTQPTVMLAEDSDFFRSHVTRTLENEGFRVIGASDGMDAWERMQSVFEEIDVLITDIEMPRMTGLELAQAVRSKPTTAAIPIIALTSLASEEDRKRGSRVGINEYQVKMDPNTLVEAVRRLSGAIS